jgi:hypothetical protein
MTVSLSAADRSKLSKLLGLLGSHHAGERDNAGTAAHRLIQSKGLSWPEVLAAKPINPPKPLTGTWRETCAQLQKRPGGFVADLPRFQRLSAKQRHCLKEIADRVLGPRGA